MFEYEQPPIVNTSAAPKFNNLIPEDVWDSFLEFVDNEELCVGLNFDNPALRRLVELWYLRGESLLEEYEQNQSFEEDEEFEEDDD